MAAFFETGAGAAGERPRERRVYLVAYDIAEGRRLRCVAECCLDHGVRVQKSLFECRLTDAEFACFWTRLTALIDPASDSLLAYPLHAQTDAGARRAGVARRPQPRVCLYG